MANVLFLKGQSQYNAMRNYIDEIEVGFRLAGYDTCVIDLLDESGTYQETELAAGMKIDILFTCNAIAWKAREYFPNAFYLTYLTDHPAYHKERLNCLDGRCVVFTCDRRHAAYARRYFPNLKHVAYVPLAGQAARRGIPYRERSRDIVFTGSYSVPKKEQESIFLCGDELDEAAMRITASILENPKQDLEEALRNDLRNENRTLSDQEFHETLFRLRGVDLYARSYYRDQTIRSLLAGGLKVCVFGNGWENFEGDGKENLVIEPGDYYLAMKAVSDARISLNVMPWFKDGFQERIAAAMLSGTVAVTDESDYIRQNFLDGGELVLYSLSNLKELPVKIKELLSRPGEAEQIARAGELRAQTELTWQHRAFEMIRYMQECVAVFPSRAQGEYGEVIRIPYRELHNRALASDVVKDLEDLTGRMNQVRRHDKWEVCDIEYFYGKFLLYFSKANAGYPELNVTRFVCQYLQGVSEDRAGEGAELLYLECMHLLAFFLSRENLELKKEREKGGSLSEGKPEGYFWKVLIRNMQSRYGESGEKEIQEILRNIQEQGFVDAYNQDFVRKHLERIRTRQDETQYDSRAGMHYARWNGKNMYYPKGRSREEVARELNFVHIEQDPLSPHRYLEGAFEVREGDIVVDAGVAEGNFALDAVEKAKKIYLVECEHSWAEALRKTFEPWKEKVVIVEKMLGDTDDGEHVTIDGLVEEGYVNFIKMDVEGAEIPALKGASKVLANSADIRCAICSYHRKNAEKEIRTMLERQGFYTSTTNGYMFFSDDMDSWIDGELRHGIVRAVKCEPGKRL